MPPMVRARSRALFGGSDAGSGTNNKEKEPRAIREEKSIFYFAQTYKKNGASVFMLSAVLYFTSPLIY